MYIYMASFCLQVDHFVVWLCTLPWQRCSTSPRSGWRTGRSGECGAPRCWWAPERRSAAARTCSPGLPARWRCPRPRQRSTCLPSPTWRMTNSKHRGYSLTWENGHWQTEEHTALFSCLPLSPARGRTQISVFHTKWRHTRDHMRKITRAIPLESPPTDRNSDFVH